MSGFDVIAFISHTIAAALGVIGGLIISHDSSWAACKLARHEWLYLVGDNLQALPLRSSVRATRVCARCGHVDDVAGRVEAARSRVLAARNGIQPEPGALSEVKQ